MIKNNKIINLLILLCTSILIFSACQKKETVLKVAISSDCKPYEYLDGDKVIGFDVDLIQLIAQKSGIKIQLEKTERDKIIPSLSFGDYDLAISALNIMTIDKTLIGISDTYYSNNIQVLLVKKDDIHFTGVTKDQLNEQFKGQTIGVCAGTFGFNYLNGNADLGLEPSEGVTAKTYEVPDMAIADLKADAISAVLIDKMYVMELADMPENKDIIKTVLTPIFAEDYCIAVKKDNQELLEKINSALKEIKDSGELNELYNTWGISRP